MNKFTGKMRLTLGFGVLAAALLPVAGLFLRSLV